jgi:lauroyl/myristoyl acyltransferase
LKQAVARGSGTILVALHAGRTGLIHHITRTLGRKELHPFIGYVSNKDQNLAMATYVRRLIEAQTLLQKGEIVTIGGDGLRGNVKLELPFYGRLFPFRSGFADLALRTGATALPVFVYFAMDGHITIEFSEALQVSPGTRQEQIEQIVRQYAQMLVERWPRLLSSMRWKKLGEIYAMPPISSASPVQKG